MRPTTRSAGARPWVRSAQALLVFALTACSGIVRTEPIPLFEGADGYSLPSGALPAIELRADRSGPAVPFTVGQVFRRGDLPAGVGLSANIGSFQAVVRNRWPDGSVKVALLSGRAPMAAGRPFRLALSTVSLREARAQPPQGSAQQRSSPAQTPRQAAAARHPAGPAGRNDAAGRADASIGIDALIAHAPQASVTLEPFGRVELATIVRGPSRQTVAGPQMSEWVFRQPVPGDANLVVWWRLRYYGGTDLDVMVGIENGHLRNPPPQRRRYDVRITIDGHQRYARTLEHYHHTRWAWQGWRDPAQRSPVPAHDGRYLSDTLLFPNYGWRSPSRSALRAQSASFEPFARNDFPEEMGSPGHHPSIGLLPAWDVFYLTSTAPSAWRAMLANAFSHGRYGLHFRDEATGEPVRLSAHPNLVADHTTGIGASGDSSTGEFTAGGEQPGVPAWIASHHPAPPYAAALLSGEWWFIEQVQFIASANALHTSDWPRGFGAGLILPYTAGYERSAAWRLRSLAMAIVVTPDDWPIRGEYQRQWASNMAYHADLHVRGTARAGRFVNRLGIFQSQPDQPLWNPRFESWWGPGWMQAFMQAVLGYTWDMDVGAREDHRLVRDFAYRLTTGLLGDANGWDYRRAGVYDMPIARDVHDQTHYFPDFHAMLLDYERNKQLTPIASFADTKLRVHSQDTTPDSLAFATGFWGNHQPARAYAVDHDAPGALAGYRRMTAAQNYLRLLESLDDLPVWGIVPRRAAAPPTR